MPRIKLSEVSINYELDGSGETVALLNGLTMDVNGWIGQVGEFSKHFKVLRHDCRGQGKSDKPDMPYTHELLAKDLNELMDRLGIVRAHLVGISNGGMIAEVFALNYPERVSKIVLVDTTSRISPILDRTLDAWIAAAHAGGIALLFDIALPSLFAESFIEKNAELIKTLKELSIERNTPQAVINLARGCKTLNVTERLNEINKPTLIIHGEEDILIPLKHAVLLHEKIKGSTLRVIKDCGHVPPVEKPEEFNRIVIEFLEGNP